MPILQRPCSIEMPPKLPAPIIYLITTGETTAATRPASEEFRRIVHVVEAAVAARVSLLQLREKKLTARVLFELARAAARLTRGSDTRLLVNERADIARAAGADGVHLPTHSLPVQVVRRTFGEQFMIGASTHSIAEARKARDGGADFAVFGPIFATASKGVYGEPVGLKLLEQVATELEPFPVVALGGIELENVAECFRAGAKGAAAITMLNDPEKLAPIVRHLIQTFSESA
jgi:thiamine-phosphate pyrophosphorylase